MEILFSSSFYTLFLAFFFFSLASTAIARGGEQASSFSGSTDHDHDFLRRRFFDQTKSPPRVDLARGYMTNFELEKAVKQFGRRCSNISRIYSIGKSVKGIPLWVMEISDKPGQQEAEPAFKATLIIRDVHLHILPTMNPDGFSLRRRGNANNIDLNRDFPDQFFPMNNDLNSRQPETKAIMNWLKERHFTASASLHGGALVANYPWDGSDDKRRQYYACPDDKTFQYMASIYSHSHYNMSLSKEFLGGITNGAFWYPIYGGMQDWNYIHAGCFELTLEISDNKWPMENEIPILWEYNRMSMLNLVASIVKTGVHGRILSSKGGQPLPASIAIKGINSTIEAGGLFGDYHRILAPGESYEVMVSMPGYKSKTTRILLEEEAMSVDFILDPVENPQLRKQVGSACDCSCDDKTNFELVKYFGVTYLEISLVVAFILAFLCFLLKRKMSYNLPKHR
ncbi:PREDICTED: carboxypeptidase SOL1 isoform X2 [Nelumbo nucifera]|uniref:Carboxypeptidase SOL1 isoform X2 n=1 Tax=Nelumbo nucifera TaxID=4432 RepID=A0A1U8A3T9_NELNU|nr:PREDICTED: carboxypeptidase SOL1 isoform X2 [Nelumbo nucifera]